MEFRLVPRITKHSAEQRGGGEHGFGAAHETCLRHSDGLRTRDTTGINPGVTISITPLALASAIHTSFPYRLKTFISRPFQFFTMLRMGNFYQSPGSSPKTLAIEVSNSKFGNNIMNVCACGYHPGSLF